MPVLPSNQAPDPSKGLTLVTTTSGAAQFRLQGNSADVGAYDYLLQKIGNNWVLVPTTTPTNTGNIAPALAAVPAVVWDAQLQQLYRRLGELRDRGNVSEGAWVRTYGSQVRVNPTGTAVTTKLFGIEGGFDHRIVTANGDWYLGGVAGTADGTQSFGTTGSGDVKPWSVGAYATWLHPQGWYADFVVRYNGMSQSFSTLASGQPSSASYHLNGYTLSAEGGRRFTLPQGFWIEPELELTAAHAGSASYRTSYGTQVQQGSSTAGLMRVEVRTGKPFPLHGDPALSVEPFVGLALVQPFGGNPTVTVAGTPLATQAHGTYGMVTAGLSAHLSPNFNLYTDLSFAKGEHYEQPWAYNVGMRYAW